METNGGIVMIHGREYKTVALRILEFTTGEKFSGHRIETEILTSNDKMVLIRATIRDAGGEIASTGHAEEFRDANQINRHSAVENCETSAVGRALSFLGLGGSEIASADEISNAILCQQQSSSGSPAAPTSPPKKFSDRPCPKCGQPETIRKSKFDDSPGFYCFKKIGGCGAKWDHDPRAESNNAEQKDEFGEWGSKLHQHIVSHFDDSSTNSDRDRWLSRALNSKANAAIICQSEDDARVAFGIIRDRAADSPARPPEPAWEKI